MTPEAAVSQLAEIVVARRAFSEDDVYAAMADAGIPTDVADRAYKFTQTAWGRAFLAPLGVRFSPDYVCFNASGDIIESGRLEDEPYFIAARALAKQHARSEGFQQLALMSADAHAINTALNKGSKAEDLVTAPVFLFLEAPTEAGMDKARRVIAQHTAAIKKQYPPKG